MINYQLILPELTLLVFAFAILLFVPLVKRVWIAPVLTVVAMALALAAVCTSWGQTQSGFFGSVVLDNFSLFCKIIFLLAGGMTCLLSHDYLTRRSIHRPEYYALLLLSIVGMMVMVSSSNLIVIFLGLEIMSLPLYVMAGFNRDSLRSNEAAVKYFFMGAFASAFFLYGIALVYGGAGTTDLPRIFASTDMILSAGRTYLLIGAVLVLVGFAFKIAAFPFHMWVPDVYQGAPTPVTAFFAIAPKAAGIATILRIFTVGFGHMAVNFEPILWLLAFLTMTAGNILAIRQDDVKRMLAYSSIAHAGYLLIAVTAGGREAVSSALFYLLAYGFFNMGAFAVVMVLEQNSGGSNHIDSFRGLASRHPWLAVVLALFMFSLAGFPPTAGFFGKFYLFAAGIKAGFIWLVIAAVLNSLISVFYYLRPVKAAFFEKADSYDNRIVCGPLVTVAIILAVIGTLVLGILPGFFLQLASGSGL